MSRMPQIPLQSSSGNLGPYRGRNVLRGFADDFQVADDQFLNIQGIVKSVLAGGRDADDLFRNDTACHSGR